MKRFLACAACASALLASACIELPTGAGAMPLIGSGGRSSVSAGDARGGGYLGGGNVGGSEYGGHTFGGGHLTGAAQPADSTGTDRNPGMGGGN